MKTEEQMKNYVPTENLMPADQIDAHTKPGYVAVPTKESSKMAVLDKWRPCPRCGVKSSLRSWDAKRQLMVYHCEGCGQVITYTWLEYVVLRLTGTLRWDENKELILPEGITADSLTVPEDPNSLSWEDLETLKEYAGITDTTSSTETDTSGYVPNEPEDDFEPEE